MDVQLFQERKQIYADAINCVKPSRVPTLGNAFGWKILDTDLEPKPTFLEATSNWDIMEKIVREHIERYPYDTHVEVGFRFNSSFRKVMDGKIRHDVGAAGDVQALDTAPLKPEEYDEIIKQGSNLFEYTTLFPRIFGELTFGELEELIRLNAEFGAFVGKMFGALVGEYSCPIVAPFALQPPMEELFNYYRGIKGLSTDMRRHPGKVLEFIEAENAKAFATLEGALAADDSAMVCNYTLALLAPTVMNKKQFEKFYLPTFKAILDRTVELGKKAYIFIEGETERLIPYLQDYKNTLLVHVEYDDVIETKKKMPDVCIAGGMPVDVLGNGTKEECIDVAKRLCDEIGGDGYVFSTNKMMAYACDGTRENMSAVLDYVLNYKL